MTPDVFRDFSNQAFWSLTPSKRNHFVICRDCFRRLPSITVRLSAIASFGELSFKHLGERGGNGVQCTNGGGCYERKILSFSQCRTVPEPVKGSDTCQRFPKIAPFRLRRRYDKIMGRKFWRCSKLHSQILRDPVLLLVSNRERFIAVYF